MANVTTVLITSAGGVNGMNVIEALGKQRKMPLRIITADASAETVAGLLSAKHYRLPAANDEKFLPALRKIIQRERVDVLLPMHSAEVYALSKQRELLKSWGVAALISDFSVVDVTWDKRKTATFFKDHHIPAPTTYTHDQITKTCDDFPLFAKPISASGTKDCRIIQTWNDFASMPTKERFIFQSYIEGVEYTIDALGDQRGRFVAASPRIRLEVKGGLAVKAVTVKNPLLVRYAKKIIETLKIVGPVNIQCMIKKNKPYFIEINTRFASGGLPLAVAAGFNIPLIIIQMLRGKKTAPIKIKSGLYMLRYQSAAFAVKKGAKLQLVDFSHSH